MEKRKVDLMIDVESLGTDADSVVLSIGILVFSRDTFSIIETFYLEFNTIDQILRGRRVSSSTQDWWLRQDKEELERLLTSKNTVDMQTLIELIKDLKSAYKIEKVWSRGCMDFHIVQDICNNPFYYNQSADVRTLDIFGVKVPTPPHNALEDCKIQLEYIKEVIQSYASKV